MRVIDLGAERQRRLPPDGPSTSKLYEAADLVRQYAKDLFESSVSETGAGDIACANLCCFADCIEREADQIEQARDCD